VEGVEHGEVPRLIGYFGPSMTIGLYCLTNFS
jgi:hypothetical protein